MKRNSLARKASPLVQELARYRVVLADPNEKSAKVDPVARLLCLMAIYKYLFKMYKDGVPAVSSALNNHAPDLVLLFESNKNDNEGEVKLMNLLERQIRAQVQEASLAPSGELSVKLATPGTDLTELFSDELPRYTRPEQGVIVLSALRLIAERYDAKSLASFIVDCEIHLQRGFWKDHGIGIRDILTSSLNSGLEEWEVTIHSAIKSVENIIGDKPVLAPSSDLLLPSTA